MEPAESVVPVGLLPGRQPQLAHGQDLRVHADGRGHDRNAAGHVLQHLEAALAPRPFVVRQRHQPHVHLLDRGHLDLLRPRHVIDASARRQPGRRVRNHPQPRVGMLVEEPSQWTFDAPEEGEVRGRARPADDEGRATGGGPGSGSKPVGIDGGGNDVDLAVVSGEPFPEVAVARHDDVGPAGDGARRGAAEGLREPDGVVDVQHERPLQGSLQGQVARQQLTLQPGHVVPAAREHRPQPARHLDGLPERVERPDRDLADPRRPARKARVLVDGGNVLVDVDAERPQGLDVLPHPEPGRGHPAAGCEGRDLNHRSVAPISSSFPSDRTDPAVRRRERARGDRGGPSPGSR